MASNKQKQSDIRDFITTKKSTKKQSTKDSTDTDTTNNSTSKQPQNSQKSANSPKPKQKQSISPELAQQLLSKISVHRGSITELRVDCVVNAANGGLWAGAGVCGAIFRAAGYSPLTKECDAIIDKYGNIPTGQSVLTKGYKLYAKHIIHSVGPIQQNNKALQSCYITALDLCILNNIKSIAFPCISTGIFGFSKELAGPLAMKTVRNWLIMAKQTKYRTYVKQLREKESQNLKEMGKRKKKKKWKWGNSNKDESTDESKEKETKEKNVEKMEENKESNNDGSDSNEESVFDRIDSIVFCCFDIGNWRLYESIAPKVFPSPTEDYSYLWSDKLKAIDQLQKTGKKEENEMDLADSQGEGSENDD